MSDTVNIKSLFVVLTSRCNLTCGYCYQNDKNARTMDWETLRASLDWVLSSQQPEVELVFYGGEPLLEMPLIRRSIDYIEERRGREKGVKYGMVTNGTLLRRDTLDFVARNRISTQLSFDGIPAAQNVRGQNTFTVLDKLLDELPTKYPEFLRELTVAVTVMPSTVRYLSDSAEFFLRKGVPEFGVSPVFTNSSQWRLEQINELEEQFSRIYELSLEHFHKTGLTPFAQFQPFDVQSSHNPSDLAMCGVSRGEKPTVDVDGIVHGCATWVDSFQSFSSDFLKDQVEYLELGNLKDPDFQERYRELEGRVKDLDMFNHKQDKYSNYARCGECRFLTTCAVCPTSIGHIPGNTDPNRVPDFKCAYNLVAGSYRELYLEETSARKMLVGSGKISDDLKAFRQDMSAAGVA